jgi:hypothetical protein
MQPAKNGAAMSGGGRELFAWEVLADLFAEEGFEIADANGAAKAAVQRLEDSGFRIADAREATAMVLQMANRGADDRMLADYAAAVLRVPPHLIPAAIEALGKFAEGL